MPIPHAYKSTLCWIQLNLWKELYKFIRGEKGEGKRREGGGRGGKRNYLLGEACVRGRKRDVSITCQHEKLNLNGVP
jgi:hypothetical protein